MVEVSLRLKFSATNNQVEYEKAIVGITLAVMMEVENINIRIRCYNGI